MARIESPTDFARQLPDLPRWVETRAILLSGTATVTRDGGGLVVRDARGTLVCVVGAPSAAAIGAALAASPAANLLCAESSAATVAAAVPDRAGEVAIIHRLDRTAPPAVPAGPGEVRDLTPAELRAASDVPAPLAAELARALERTQVVAVVVDGSPVSFCYSAWETETLWDLSIDTLAAHRQRGLARRAATTLIVAQRRRGKEPVWGTLWSNLASRALAARLGFAPCDRLVVFPADAPDQRRS